MIPAAAALSCTLKVVEAPEASVVVPKSETRLKPLGRLMGSAWTVDECHDRWQVAAERELRDERTRAARYTGARDRIASRRPSTPLPGGGMTAIAGVVTPLST